MGEPAQRPKLFVGSSREAVTKGFVGAIQTQLTHYAEVTPWCAGTFEVNHSTIEDLEQQLDMSDFAVFVFTPDDIAIMREHTYLVPRDNVIFEMGLFWGKLRRDRVFYVVPSSVPKDREGVQIEGFHIMSDLQGLTVIKYDANHQNVEAGLFSACDSIRKKIEEQGYFDDPEEALTELTDSLDKQQSIVNFLLDLNKEVLRNPSKQYDFLCDGIRMSFDLSPFNRYSVKGAAVWKATGTDGLQHLSGNIGVPGTLYPYNINTGKSEDDKTRNVLVDVYHSKDEQAINLNRKGVVSAYLLCYPIGEEYVITVQIQGPNPLSDDDIELLFESNGELMGTIEDIYGGGDEVA